MPKLSIETAINFGWNTLKQHWTTLVPVIFLLTIASSILSHAVNPVSYASFSSFVHTAPTLSQFARTLLSTSVGLIFTALAIRVCLQYVDGKVTDFSSLFQGITPEMLVKVIAATIIVNVMVVIGLFLLIIPGIYLLFRFSQVSYVIVDRDTSISEALRESSRLTNGVKWTLFLLYVSCLVMVILGFIALFVGIFIALPVIYLSLAHSYRQLTKTVDDAAPAS